MQPKANILVVDDEMGPRESLKMILKSEYNVIIAQSGSQAVSMLGQFPIDLVTLDLKMPGVSGIKVLEKIKEYDPDIEVIIITGYGSMDTAIEGLRLGAFDYISKPFDVNHIMSLFRRALQRRSARVKLRELKTEFLCNVSHELRTPLSVIVGFVSLLLDQPAEKLTAEHQKILERVYSNSQDLMDLIDNMLWVTSFNAGHSAVLDGAVNISAMVQECLQRFEKTIGEKGLEVSVQIPENVSLVTDSAKLNRILLNLIHNSVKFTPRGKIAIRGKKAPGEDLFEIVIQDTGIGIPRDKIDDLFKPFTQLDSSLRRQFSGLGFGLAVAQRLTDYIGGQLELRSEPDFGTEVRLFVPYRRHSESVRASALSSGVS